VHRTPDAAQTPGVARAAFERQTGFIHGLQNFGGALKEEVAKFVGAIVGQKCH
jgi:hypothetical protein